MEGPVNQFPGHDLGVPIHWLQGNEGRIAELLLQGLEYFGTSVAAQYGLPTATQAIESVLEKASKVFDKDPEQAFKLVETATKVWQAHGKARAKRRKLGRKKGKPKAYAYVSANRTPSYSSYQGGQTKSDRRERYLNDEKYSSIGGPDLNWWQNIMLNNSR